MSLYVTATSPLVDCCPLEEIPFDDKSHTPYWSCRRRPRSSRRHRLVIVFTPAVQVAGPVIKKSMADRTAGIQASSTTPRRPRPPPTPRRRASARPRATSTPSAPACSPRPTRRPRRCSPTAAPASRPRSPNSRPRPTTDIAAAAGRGADELRAEIARYSATGRRPRRRRHARRRCPAGPDRRTSSHESEQELHHE